MSNPRIIPGDQPAYVPTGKGNELMLLAEFSRTVTVICDRCRRPYPYKLLADEVIAEQKCTDILESHLRDIGWYIGAEDHCPACNTSRSA